MWVGLWRKLSAEKLMPLNYGVGEDSWVPWTARRSNQAILKEISPGCSLEGLMLKLKLQCFDHLIQRANSFENTQMLGKNEGRKRRGWQRMWWLDGITDSMDMMDREVGDGQGSLECCSPWGCKELDMTEPLNWSELKALGGEKIGQQCRAQWWRSNN